MSALGVGQICSWGSLYYSFPQIAAAVGADMGWHHQDLYLAATLGLLLSSLLSVPAGMLIDRGHGRWVMAGGSLAAGLLFLALSRVETLTGFTLCVTGIGGLFAAVLYEPAFAVVARRVGALAARPGITRLTLWGGFASTVFIPLIELVMPEIGWRGTARLLAGVNIGLCLPLYALSIRPDRDAARETVATGASSTVRRGGAIGGAIRRPVFWMVGLFFLAQAGLMSAFTYHMYPLFQEQGLSAAQAVTLIALIGPAQVAARVGIAIFAARWSISAIGTATMVSVVAIFVGFLVAPPTMMAFAVLALGYGATNGIITIVRGMSVPHFLGGRGYGTLNGLLNTPSMIAKALAPVAIALLWNPSGDQGLALLAMLAGSVVMAGAFLGAVLLGRQERTADGAA